MGRPLNIWIGEGVKQKLEEFCIKHFGELLMDKIYGEIGRLAILYALEHENDFINYIKNKKREYNE
ncbi:MAG: hypothetical protein ACTSSP_04415 [Candidatus Asgardarchaeia archaeon]